MNDRNIYPLGKRRTLIVFFGLMLGMLLAALDQTIVSTALPAITQDLGGFEHYSWVFSAYMLGATVTVPLYGKLSDIYGRRPFFLLGISLFSTGSIICGLATSMEMLIAGRAVQGLGAGGLIPLAIAAIGDIIPPRRRGKWQGFTGAVFAASSVLGPAVGGWLTDNGSWRWCFFVNLPLAAVALVVVWFGFVRQTAQERHSLDYVGALLLTTGAAAGLLAAVWGGAEYPWGSPVIGILLSAAVALLSGFVLWESRAREPILPLDLFNGRTFSSASVASLAVGAAMFGAIIYVPLFVQRVLGESASASGAVLTPLMLGIIATSVLAGQIVSRTGHYRPVLLAGPPLLATGFLLLSRIGVHTSELTVTRDVVIVGFGVGLMMQTLTVAVQNSVGRRRIGVATASVQFFRTIGAMVGVSVMGAVMTARLGGSATARGVSPAGLAGALHPIFLIAIGLAMVALVAILFVPHIELRQTLDEPARSPELLEEAA
jgi:EmrB/QacA subfamily drug resistance transporter